ncbi:MAG: HAMP domain-containing sensor histidine kinase [Clostridia bacterium]|nr:HAMP domain-containing sensor histidine kinase [Clostridia bacterium]
MFKSIFNRLIATYLIIIIVTLIFLGFLLSQLFENYYFNKKQEQLITEGSELNDLVNQYSAGLISEQRLNFELQVIDRFLNARIWFVDKFGYVWTESSTIDKKHQEGQKLTKDEIINVLQGNIVKKTGKFGDRFEVPMLTIGMPIYVKGRVTGAIFLHSPIYEIKNTLNNVYRLIWIAALVSIILAFLLIYSTSKRISMPLKKMSSISRAMAEGDFSKRVDINSPDEIGELSNAFNNMAMSLENLENMRRDFVASVSHELKSPIASIRGFVQAIRDGTIEHQEQEEYLNIVIEETNRLTRLINQLLDLSNIETGYFVLENSVFDINEVIRRVIIKYEQRIKEKQIDLKVMLSKNDKLVKGDEDRIEQVVSNLMDNAIKYTGMGGEVRVATQAREHKIFTHIEDSGMGIAQEDLPYIFERFYKVDNSRSESSGFGLGLSIVKKIIEQHEGGQIYARSEKGKGTEFIFYLPLYYNKDTSS